MSDPWLRRLYLALAVVALAPIWSASYLPTVDGPSHVYNSWVLKELVRGNHGIVSEWYAVDWRPNPNWSGHAVLAVLMTVVPPLIAEKILVSGIVLLFLYGIWLFAGAVDESRRAFAFFAFPFAYNLPLQMGFYNFCIGAALYFVIVAVWWRRRDRPDWQTVAITVALLVLCYFSHPLPALLAVGSVAVLWLATLPGRRPLRHALHLVALLPALALLIWFWRQRGATLEAAHYSGFGLFSYIMRMWVMLSFDDYQTKLGLALFCLLAALIVITLVRRQWRWSEGDGFVLLTLAIIVLFARAPMATSGGTMLMERMALFVVLSPLAWIAPRLPRRVMAAVVIVLTIVSLGYTGYLVRRYRSLSRRITELVSSAAALEPASTLLPLVRDVRPAGSIVPVLMHAIDYAAVEKGDVDIGNYEAGTGYFPIRFRPGVVAPDIPIGQRAAELDLKHYLPRALFVYTWHISPEAPVMRQIEAHCIDVGGAEGGRVYRIR
jgi:hypothetical protein